MNRILKLPVAAVFALSAVGSLYDNSSEVHAQPRVDMPTRGICAHRGASLTHPENTLVALDQAIRLGAHMLEFDVTSTRDGQLVLMHDATVDRTTNGTGPIGKLTLKQLSRLDAGSWKGTEFQGEPVPLLSDVLRKMPDNIWLNVHLKGNSHLAEQVTRGIAAENRLHQALLACDATAAQAAKRIDARVMVCNMERLTSSEEYVNATIAAKAEFIQLLGRRRVAFDLVPQLKQNGIRINFCCTNDAVALRRLFDAGIDFPLVDDVRHMVEVAAKNGIAPLTPIFRNRD